MKTVCLSTSRTLRYPQGGHLWVFINWALGFKDLGFQVIWLDIVQPGDTPGFVRENLAVLRERLAPLGLDGCIALLKRDGGDAQDLFPESDLGLRTPEEVFACDLLLNARYDLPLEIVSRYKQSILLDIDPGLLQFSMRKKRYDVPQHSVYVSIGLNLDHPFLDTGHIWHHVPPCCHLPSWPPISTSPNTFTSVTHWLGESMVDEKGECYENDKRTAFFPYLNLPAVTSVPLELALYLPPSEDWHQDHSRLAALGWTVRDSHQVGDTPLNYRHYIQNSLGEFSCAKPSYVRMQTAWVSDRTICYLASGRPAVVEFTGDHPSYPGHEGLLRFSSPEQAAVQLRDVVTRYEHHSRCARQLAEEVFDAAKVITKVLSLLE